MSAPPPKGRGVFCVVRKGMERRRNVGRKGRCGGSKVCKGVEAQEKGAGTLTKESDSRKPQKLLLWRIALRTGDIVVCGLRD